MILQGLPLSDLDLSNLSDLPRLDVPFRSVPAASSHALSHARLLGLENLDPSVSPSSTFLVPKSLPQNVSATVPPSASLGAPISARPEDTATAEETTLARLVRRFRQAPASSRESRDRVPEDSFWWLRPETATCATGAAPMDSDTESTPQAAPTSDRVRDGADVHVLTDEPPAVALPADDFTARIERIQELLRARERALLERGAAPSSAASAREARRPIRTGARPAPASTTTSSSRTSSRSSRSRSASPLDPAVSMQGIGPASAAGAGGPADTDPSLASRLDEAFLEEPARRPVFAGGPPDGNLLHLRIN